MPSFFYAFALPLVACATGWALFFLPSKSTGEQGKLALLDGALLAMWPPPRYFSAQCVWLCRSPQVGSSAWTWAWPGLRRWPP